MKKIALSVMIGLLNALAFAQTLTLPPTPPPSSSGELLRLTPAQILELVNDCGERTASMQARIFDYTYTHTSTFRERDKRGQVTRELISVLEAYPVRGRRFAYVPVSGNGEPISRKRIERARERATRELQQDEKRIASAQNRPDAPQPENQVTHYFGIFYDRQTGLTRKRFSIVPTDLLGTHDFYAPRRAIFNNREVIILSFRPRADAAANDLSARLRARLGGRIWIDAKDRVLVRLEALPVTELTDVEVSTALAPDANAPVLFEWARLPNGTWMPSLNLINSYGREAVFEDIKFDFFYRLSNFILFSTDIERVEIKPPKE
jgi:hypothetical protein